MGLPPELGLDPIQGSGCSQRQAVRQASRQAREQATRQARQSTSQRAEEWEGWEEQNTKWRSGRCGVKPVFWLRRKRGLLHATHDVRCAHILGRSRLAGYLFLHGNKRGGGW